jgi:hypothetical protein
MKAQFIYTYEDALDQEIINYPIMDKKHFKSKEKLIDFAVQELAPSEVEELVKISACISLDENEKINPPQWYLDCNGKFYFENGKLI